MLNYDKSLLRAISAKIRKAKRSLKQIGYVAVYISAKEFYDYMTGEIFSEDTNTLYDVLGNEFLTVHELAEMSELKRIGRTIDKRVIVNLPKTLIYEAHFRAHGIRASICYVKKRLFLG